MRRPSIRHSALYAWVAGAIVAGACAEQIDNDLPDSYGKGHTSGGSAGSTATGGSSHGGGTTARGGSSSGGTSSPNGATGADAGAENQGTGGAGNETGGEPSTSGGAGATTGSGGAPVVGMTSCDGGATSSADGGSGGQAGPDYAVELDGNGDCIDVATTTDINLTGDFTVEAWFKDENPNYNHGRAYLASFGNTDTDSDIPFTLDVEGSKYWGWIRHSWVPDVNNIAGNTEQIISSATSGSTNTWHHLAFTHDATSHDLTLYLDGAELTTDDANNASTASSKAFHIGCGEHTGTHWNGLIDDVRVWDVARTASEILGNYAAELTCTPTGLVANWKFDEGAGTTASDSVGAHHGTFLGDTAFSSDTPH